MKAESNGYQEQKEMKDKERQPPLTKEQQEAQRFYFTRFTKARDQRNSIRTEFDDLTYEEDYELNRKAGFSYLRKKKNDDEVRINTGTQEKKVEAVMNDLMAMNFQPEIVAFDKDNLRIKELGDDMGDLVMQTNEMEHDEDFRIEALHELLCQRALFVEEIEVDKTVTDKIRQKKRDKKTNAAKYKMDTYNIHRPEKRVLSGLQVFLGDISIPAYLFDTQPYVVKYDRINYWEAKQIFGDFPNWEYVRPGMPGSDYYGTNFKYRFGTIMKDEVEIITYMSYPDDEYNIIINGVMMYEPGEPLPWEHEGYNIKMEVLKPIARCFAYGRSLIASSKTLQALDNETLRVMIRKMRQAIEPPTGVPQGAIYSRDIWAPAAQTQGIKKGDIFSLIDHNGVTASEMKMYQLITSKTEEFIGRSDVSQVGAGKMTATQTMEIQKQAVKMLGMAVYAWMRTIRDCTFLRIYNLTENFMSPVAKKADPVTNKIQDVYRRFTVEDARLENDKSGTKVIQFMNRDLKPEEEEGIHQFEKSEEDVGNNIRFKTINVKKLREIPIFWKISVNQKERDGSALNKVLFHDMLGQAQELSKVTQRPLNADKWIERFESTWRDKDLFQKPAPQMQGDGGEEGTEGQGDGQVSGQAQDMMKKLAGLEGGGGQSSAAQGVNKGISAGKPSLKQVMNASMGTPGGGGM